MDPAELLEMDDQDGALLAALERHQQRQQAERAGLQDSLGRQQGAAGGLRTLSLLTAMGDNPLLRGIQQASGQQGAQMEGLAARTEGRLASLGGGMDPLALARLKLSALAPKIRAEEAAKQRTWSEGQREKDRASRERAAALAAGIKSDDTTEKQTKEFGDEVVKSGAPGFYERYDIAAQLLDKHKGDLPGFGRVEGRLPDEMLSEDGRALRQAVGQLLSEYRKGQSGAGMSDGERVEYGRITGLLQTGDEQSVRQGVEQLRAAMDARLRATAGSFRPEAVKTYGSRVPRVGAALALPKDEKGQPTLDGPGLSPQDAAALKWAQSNPNDPRSAKILERLKAKGAAP